MFKTLSNAWRIKEIRSKMIFTLLMIVVYRLGNIIPIPFMDKTVVNKLMSSNAGGLVNLLDLLAGGSLKQMSVFALSIYPYITASIVVQLLTIAFPRLGEIARDGEMGRKKVAKYTKIGAVILGIFEAMAIANGLFAKAIVAKGYIQSALIITSLLAGSMFLVWLGEMITEKGIGNGISIIIFLGIVSNLPTQVGTFIYGIATGTVGILTIIGVVLAAIAIVVIVVLINEGERKITVQYAKKVVGRKMYGGQATHIPVKVNMSGVMPVIFASSLLAMPQTLSLLFSGGTPSWISSYLTVEGSVGVYVYSILNFMLIILFGFFYSSIQFNTVEYAKNLQQYGGFIPGIRPGKPTGEYLQKISNRITFSGSIILALIASAPIVISRLSGMKINFGGTSAIIIVGVVIETMKQIESMMLMRHYKGFLNK
ncbi:preprotein translocase subunit SecY [Parvimonas micra]|uniref:preprotein translocase subunit SecY n=1 Tax=Parvimonas TaxID=543311 RepID=UPI00020DDA87|nr:MULTISPECIES: preprotein translocase subunit SecY [unclassified Parvimonas]EGL38612.1 preprotein translocase, SecY subunit [Parvimonas sp. oral taxon 110 str. F0139]MBF1295110.1 preprotein translocase subunit SecY [Parvimonas sp.]MBF1299476.1 preprotein translocase subunit SecY [Parvimonas sp.]MEB3011588.1 preprotein translocase subunit SecY [Parvimonas sp. D2]MEB3087080.1 preprotein translocase subunit SecY [Parvimonas sp. D4]